MWIPKFLCPILLSGCEKCAWSAQSEKKKKIDKLIVAMALPKMGKKKKKKSGPKSGESKKKRVLHS